MSDAREEPHMDNVSDQEKELATTCLNDFEKRNYQSSIHLLGKLRSSRPHDNKVALNEVVVEYYKSNLKRTDLFMKNMLPVSAEMKIKVDDMETLEECEQCIVFYNQAVLLYHKREYHQALNILNKVFSFVEPLEDILAQRVCFLLLELHLVVHQPDRVLSLTTFMENTFLGGAAGGPAPLAAQLNKPNSPEGNLPGGKASKTQPPEKLEPELRRLPREGWTESHRARLMEYRARAAIMLSDLKQAEDEMTQAHSTSGETFPSVILRSNIEYLHGNSKQAIVLLNSIPRPHPEFENHGESVEVIYYNNMAVIHLSMRKPNLACFYLKKAIEKNERAISSVSDGKDTLSTRPLFTLGSNNTLHLMYNLGICLLHANKPQEAFDYLISAVQIYRTNPQLWLRLAECCIRTHKADNASDFQTGQRRKDLVQGVIGTGTHRKLVLSGGLSSRYISEGNSPAIPMVSLEFGALCLKNAMTLISEEPNIRWKRDTGLFGMSLAAQFSDKSDGNVKEFLHVAPSNPLSKARIQSLKSSILVASAYVCLSLSDYQGALNHSESLLMQPNLSSPHKFLGHLYTAEALVMLDRIPEANEHLNVDLIAELSFTEEDVKPEGYSGAACGWFPNSLMTAQIIMMYNLTVSYACRGELQKAADCLRQVFLSKGPQTEIPIQALMLALYIQVQLGHTDIARSMIKQQHCPQYR